MIFPHQQKTIDYITDKMLSDDKVDALLISGSIMHGFHNENSDVDINIVVSDEIYMQKAKEQALTYYETAEAFYPGGYIDGKYINLDYLAMVAERGNEPTRFALYDVNIAFDRTGQVADYIKKIGTYQLDDIQKTTIRFLSQLDVWKWYCDEALKRDNRYLLDVSVSKVILFAGRLILLENRTFFPYHKWFLKVLDGCKNKPLLLMSAIEELLQNKSSEKVNNLYEMVKNYKDWTGGVAYSCSSNFVHDTETVWMRGEEFIENM